MISRVRSKDSSCGISSSHIESSGEVEQGILKKKTIALNQTAPSKCFHVATQQISLPHEHAIFKYLRYLEPVLTIVHAEYDCSTKKGTDCLKHKIHGKLPPALSPQQTQGKGDRGIQVATCKCEVISVNIRSRIG